MVNFIRPFTAVLRKLDKRVHECTQTKQNHQLYFVIYNVIITQEQVYSPTGLITVYLFKALQNCTYILLDQESVDI